LVSMNYKPMKIGFFLLRDTLRAAAATRAGVSFRGGSMGKATLPLFARMVRLQPLTAAPDCVQTLLK